MIFAHTFPTKRQSTSSGRICSSCGFHCYQVVYSCSLSYNEKNYIFYILNQSYTNRYTGSKFESKMDRELYIKDILE